MLERAKRHQILSKHHNSTDFWAWMRFSASSKTTEVDLRVRTPAATIGIRGTAFDVLADPRKTEVSVIVGRIQVSSQFGSKEVGPGQTFAVESTSGAKFAPEQSAKFAAAVGKMLSMISQDNTMPKDKAEEVKKAQEQQSKQKNFTHIQLRTLKQVKHSASNLRRTKVM